MILPFSGPPETLAKFSECLTSPSPFSPDLAEPARGLRESSGA